MAKLSVNLIYPYSEEYEYETSLSRIDLDKERIKDISSGNGFIIGPHAGKIKKDLKDPNGIFSEKYGRTLKDLNPYSTKYRCECGYYMFKINNNLTCPMCNKPVRYRDDNFEYFGWKIINKPNFIIHPSLFKTIESFIGKDRLQRILSYENEKNIDGYVIENTIDYSSDEPFAGIGMISFKEKFDEIINYYNSMYNTPTKKAYYEDIINNRNIIFANSIPVFTLLLRPVDVNQQNFCREDTNDDYVIINRIVTILNRYDELKIMQQEKSPIDKLLFNLQSHINNLYLKLDKILQGKKGVLRSLLAARYNFSSRCVITPNPDLRIHQIKLPYVCLCEILQQKIINVLIKTYNISGSDAYNIWYNSLNKPNQIIINIIESFIKNSCSGNGIPFIINRNPTIAFGGILQMYCVGINFNYTMGIPLQILRLLAADFDGDVLNIMLIINDDFYQRSHEIYCPRYMYISHNDGKFNNAVNHQKDTIINGNTLLRLGNNVYTQTDIDNILRIKNKWKK